MSKSKAAGRRTKKARKGKRAAPSATSVKAALAAVPKKRRPKAKCCLSQPRCRRCPLQMLAAGTLPPGLTVRHRRVVVDPAGT